jgi:hypothetical protein
MSVNIYWMKWDADQKKYELITIPEADVFYEPEIVTPKEEELCQCAACRRRRSEEI